MPTSEEIPPSLVSPANAALAWLNETRGTRFRLTGVVDTEAALAAKPGDPLEFGLILCENEICLCERVRVAPAGDGYEVTAIESADAEALPDSLDPPVGVRSTWIDEQLERFNFILLLFYRGRW
ncbi:MAG: hypothetical protein HKP27_11780 [Myxococcales bacterium]|nr:hypothetical protein [Myxococcales bacterium]